METDKNVDVCVLKQQEQHLKKTKEYKEIMDSDEFCDYIGISRPKLKDFINEHCFPCFKFGKKLFFSKKRTDEWFYLKSNPLVEI